MDSHPKGPALSILDDSRVSSGRQRSNLPPKNSAIPRLVLAWLTMVVSLAADIFPSQIGVSIPGGSPSIATESRTYSSHERQTRVVDDIDARMIPTFC